MFQDSGLGALGFRYRIQGLGTRGVSCNYLRVVSWALHVVPDLLYRVLMYGNVWALNLCRVYKGRITRALLRAHTKGPFYYP